MDLNVNRLGFNRLTQWLSRRQMRVLEEAYQGALEIKALEDKYFEGGKIAYSPAHSKTVYDYVKSLRDRQLLRVRSNLAQFQVNSFVLPRSTPTAEFNPDFAPDLSSDLNLQDIPTANLSANPPLSQEATVVAKLNFIDEVIRKYRDFLDDLEPQTPSPPDDTATNTPPKTTKLSNKDEVAKLIDPVIVEVNSPNSKPHRTGFFKSRLPIGKEIEAYEEQVVQQFRLQRKQSKIAQRWLVILLVIPILVHFLSRQLVFEPLLGNYSEKNPTRIELNQEIQEKFLAEMTRYKEGLEVQDLLGLTPANITEAEKRKQLEEKAVELWREAREEALSSKKNLLADGVALAVFAGLVFFNRDKLAVVRSFSNRTFLNLSDPTKVFLFILVTDMFVGFHSAEGWEVILEGIATHLGLPESKTAIYLFIATVPVIVDSCIKFWIFTYLTRYSPSASAIYERMNT